jgi:hypothetical protein
MMVMRTPLLLVVGAGAALGANILLNPSFELWMDTIGVHMPVGWYTSEGLFPGSALKDSGSHSGQWCVHLTGGDTAAFMTTATLVRPGNHYEFTGFARVPGVLAGTFALQFLSLMGGLIGTPELIPVYYSGTTYRDYSRWVTAPDSAMFLSVSFATLPGAAAFVDDVTLDDTTVRALLERPAAAVRRLGPRKSVILRADGEWRTANGVRFDALGRCVRGSARPGVYFRVE